MFTPPGCVYDIQGDLVCVRPRRGRECFASYQPPQIFPLPNPPQSPSPPPAQSRPPTPTPTPKSGAPAANLFQRRLRKQLQDSVSWPRFVDWALFMVVAVPGASDTIKADPELLDLFNDPALRADPRFPELARLLSISISTTSTTAAPPATPPMQSQLGQSPSPASRPGLTLSPPAQPWAPAPPGLSGMWKDTQTGAVAVISVDGAGIGMGTILSPAPAVNFTVGGGDGPGVYSISIAGQTYNATATASVMTLTPQPPPQPTNGPLVPQARVWQRITVPA